MFKPLGDRALPDHVGEPLRAELLVGVDGARLGWFRRARDLAPLPLVVAVGCPLDDGLSHRSVPLGS